MTPAEHQVTGIRIAAQRLNCSVESMEFLTGDVSHRRYIRLHSDSGTRIACCYPEPFNLAESASERFRRLRSEDSGIHLTWASDPLAFIESTEWFSRIGIPVPEIYDVYDDLGIVILQDIGDVSLQSIIHSNADEIESYYLTALSYIDRIQESSHRINHRDMLARLLKLDAEKLGDELELLLRGIGSFIPEIRDKFDESELRTEWRMLAELAAPETPVLCHRDYHARNLYIFKNTLFVIDHQDLRMGHFGYDCASLLYDPYVSFTCDQRDRLRDTRGSYSMDRLAPVIIQRLLKAVGTYINEVNMRRNVGFLRSISTATGDIKKFFDNDMMVGMPITVYLVDAIHERVITFKPE